MTCGRNTRERRYSQRLSPELHSTSTPWSAFCYLPALLSGAPSPTSTDQPVPAGRGDSGGADTHERPRLASCSHAGEAGASRWGEKGPPPPRPRPRPRGPQALGGIQVYQVGGLPPAGILIPASSTAVRQAQWQTPVMLHTPIYEVGTGPGYTCSSTPCPPCRPGAAPPAGSGLKRWGTRTGHRRQPPAAHCHWGPAAPPSSPQLPPGVPDAAWRHAAGDWPTPHVHTCMIMDAIMIRVCTLVLGLSVWLTGSLGDSPALR